MENQKNDNLNLLEAVVHDNASQGLYVRYAL